MGVHSNPQLDSSLLSELASRVVDVGATDPDTLNRLKLEFCREHELSWMPRNSDILSVLPAQAREKYVPSLRLKKVRSISGVNVIGVMRPGPSPVLLRLLLHGLPEAGFVCSGAEPQRHRLYPLQGYPHPGADGTVL